MMISMKKLFNTYFMSAVYFSFCKGVAVMVMIFASYVNSFDKRCISLCTLTDTLFQQMCLDFSLIYNI